MISQQDAAPTKLKINFPPLAKGVGRFEGNNQPIESLYPEGEVREIGTRMRLPRRKKRSSQ